MWSSVFRFFWILKLESRMSTPSRFPLNLSSFRICESVLLIESRLSRRLCGWIGSSSWFSGSGGGWLVYWEPALTWLLLFWDCFSKLLSK